MKKILLSLALLIGLTPVMMEPDAIDDLAVALASFSGKGKLGIEEQAVEKPVKRILPGTPEYNAMLKERIRKIREAVKHNDLLTPQQAQDALIIYLAAQFTLVFTPLADEIAKVVETTFKDESTAAAVRKLPGAFGDGILLLYYLTTQIVTPKENRQKYIGHLVKIRDSVKCLLANEADRLGLRDTKGNLICANMTNYKDAFKQMLGNLKEFIMPIAEVMALGIQAPDGAKIEGFVVQGANVILPQFTKDIKIVTELIEMILNLSEQFKKGLDAPAQLAITAA